MWERRVKEKERKSVCADVESERDLKEKSGRVSRRTVVRRGLANI